MSNIPSQARTTRILAISGSLRRASANTAALEALGRLAPEGIKLLLCRDLAKPPPFDPDDDIEDKPKPEPVEMLRTLVDAGNALVIAPRNTPMGFRARLRTRSRTRSTGWWRARPSPASPPRLINTSTRAFHEKASLREILSTMAARLIPEAFVSISLTGKAVAPDDILADAVCTTRLTECLEALVAAARSG